MKKVLAIIACLAVCLSLSACNGNSGKDNNSSQIESEVSSDNIQEMLEEYVATVKDAMESQSNDTVELTVAVRDNSMVMTSTYKIDIPEESMEAVKEALDSGLESNEETFMSAFEELKKAVPGAESFIVEYATKDGEIITSKEYK